MHAHRRGISTFKALLIVLGIFLLGFCAWSGWLVHWALNATPAISIDYGQKLNELALTRQDGTAKNEYDTLMRLGSTLRQIEDEFQQKYGRASDAPPDWDAGLAFPVDLGAVEAAAASPKAKAIALEYLERVKSSTVPADIRTVAEAGLILRPPVSGALINLLIPELGDSRKAARYSRARCVLAAEAGDWDAVTRAIADIRGLSRAANRDPLLIGYLVGIAIDAQAADLARELLVKHDVPPAALDRLAEVFNEDATRRPVSDSFDAEKIFFLDMCQRSHDASGRFIPSAAGGLAGTGGPGAGSPPIANVLAIAMPSRAQTEEMGLRVYERMKELSLRPRGERRGSTDDYLGIEVPQRYIIVQLMIPAVGKAIGAGDQGLQQQRATRVMVALERYRAARGAYPEDLRSLVPAYLDGVPADPYSDLGFLYKRGETPERRATYTLYSVGDDNQDNAGARARSEYDALRVEGKGTDMVFMPVTK
ncbi:MAG: hypothetical protein IT432_11250 [Phycisphaerales bacterium]|nr:hypothetical protein [Phycisphaerales bacterium]